MCSGINIRIRNFSLFFKCFLGDFGDGSAAFGYPGVIRHGFRVLFLSDVTGGKFGQHIHHQLLISHIVAEIFLFETFEVLVFAGG